ncbi:VIT1/CCC1 transporter family protein [Candidatus Micrarchaeota archaeon]|nr:VIT1/CCC1 transporter family protein [Candidatus Micrarchaeota archaeon]
MPRLKNHPHLEGHTASRGLLLRNIILGGQDGIVNVLGIVLGVATATNSNGIVLLAGLAATFAESISMAAVAFTSTRAEEEHYQAEVKRELEEMDRIPDMERKEIEEIYRAKGFSGKLLGQVVDKITSNRKIWLETMMQEELGLENPSESMSSFWQGVLVGLSAVVGSLVPVAPFFFLPISAAIPVSLAASLALLFAVGAGKSQFTSGRWLYGGIELMIIGGAAALVGYLVGVVFQVPV